MTGLLIIETVLLVVLLMFYLRQRRVNASAHPAKHNDQFSEYLELALWGSGEQFWDYDIRTHRLRIKELSQGATPPILSDTGESDPPLIHPQDQELFNSRLQDHLEGRTELFISEHRIDPHDNGNWVWVRVRGRIFERDAQGNPIRMTGTARDITANRHADAERRIASEVLRNMNEAVAVLDHDFRFVAVNPAFTRITGFGDMEALGMAFVALVSDRLSNDERQDIFDRFEEETHWQGNIWMRSRKHKRDYDDSEHPELEEDILCEVKHNALRDANGNTAFRVVVLNDITEQTRAAQHLLYLANYDEMTGLPNRKIFNERLEAAILRARQVGSYVAILFLDLDRFKDVNDSLGHAVGDRVLHAAAERVKQVIGPQHTVARLGGDEFTVILENLASPEEASIVARRLIDAFSAPLIFGNLGNHREISVSVSIGISLFPDHAQVPGELLNHSDTAMYHAKAAGRRSWQMYSPQMDETTQQRATLANSLRRALERRELRLEYQPRYSLTRQRTVGVEALLRWKSEEFGVISPQQFIPLAENTGTILELGPWALYEACSTLRRWQQLGISDINVSVNVSAVQLQRDDLPETLKHILKDTGISARCLELELTESAIMTNFQHNASILDACRDLGTSIAVDDFGTGYSSLAYLKRLPITALKIDREFISDLTRDPDDEAIASAIINMGHSLDLMVVAEGVETMDQLRYLQQNDCDEVQGFLISHPLDAVRCLEYLIKTPRPLVFTGNDASRRLL